MHKDTLLGSLKDTFFDLLNIFFFQALDHPAIAGDPFGAEQGGSSAFVPQGAIVQQVSKV